MPPVNEYSPLFPAWNEKDRLAYTSDDEISLPSTPSSPLFSSGRRWKKENSRWYCTRKRALLVGGIIILALVAIIFSLTHKNQPDQVNQINGIKNDNTKEIGNKIDGIKSETTETPISIFPPLKDDPHELSNNSNHSLIDYSNYTIFPLKPNQYRYECSKFNGDALHYDRGYWHSDPEFKDISHKYVNKITGKKYCAKTLTYLLDENHGFTYNLNGLLQARFLAKSDNRTFFIDDTYWQMGKWSQFFKNVEKSDCLPPLSEELVACPRSTRHLVITPLTFIYHLGHDYIEEWENAYGHDVERLVEFFKADEIYLKELFQLNQELENLINQASKSFISNGNKYVSLHIRKGDLHPLQYEHHLDYIPIEKYLEKAKELWNSTYGEEEFPTIYIASDDSTIIHKVKDAQPNWNFLSAFQDDEKERSNYFMTIKEMQRPDDIPLSKFKPKPGYYQSGFDILSTERRTDLARGFIVDLVLASKANAGVVCTVSSNVCITLAAMQGWDKAIEKKKWVNVDGLFDWKPVPKFD